MLTNPTPKITSIENLVRYPKYLQVVDQEHKDGVSAIERQVLMHLVHKHVERGVAWVEFFVSGLATETALHRTTLTKALTSLERKRLLLLMRGSRRASSSFRISGAQVKPIPRRYEEPIWTHREWLRMTWHLDQAVDPDTPDERY